MSDYLHARLNHKRVQDWHDFKASPVARAKYANNELYVVFENGNWASIRQVPSGFRDEIQVDDSHVWEGDIPVLHALGVVTDTEFQAFEQRRAEGIAKYREKELGDDRARLRNILKRHPELASEVAEYSTYRE